MCLNRFFIHYTTLILSPSIMSRTRSLFNYFFPAIFMWSDLKWIFISDFITDTYRSIGVELRLLLFWQIYSRSLQGWKLPLLRCSYLIRDVISPLKMLNLLLCLPLIFSVSSPLFFMLFPASYSLQYFQMFVFLSLFLKKSKSIFYGIISLIALFTFKSTMGIYIHVGL